MTKVHEITRAFLEAHPAEAARVLEHVAPSNCAALLNALPLRLAIDVLKHLLPSHAARCLEDLKPQAAVGLLRALSPQTGADMLRHLPEDERDALLAELPRGVALGLRLLASYPQDAVGAWIDTRVPALPPDATAKESIDRVRRTAKEAGEYLYIVSADQILRGVVRLVDVVRAGTKTLVSDVMTRPAPALSARAPLSAARAHSAWRDFHAIGVVDHEGRFLGALSYGVLARASARQPPAALTPSVVSETFSTIATTYWFGLSNLIQAAIPLLTARGTRGRR